MTDDEHDRGQERGEDSPASGDERTGHASSDEPSLGSASNWIAWLVGIALLVGAVGAWFVYAPQPLFGLLGSDGGGPQGQSAQGGQQGQAPVSVEVYRVEPAIVPIYLDYTGQTVATRSVSIQARVTGYLTERNFEEGTLVEEGDALYRIDPRPFQIALDQAVAQRDAQQASVALAEAQLARLEPLAQQDFASQAQLDERQSQLAQARATVRQLDATIAEAQLDLEFTTIEAPFAGRIGFSEVEVGALITSDQALTTLMTLDPMFVRFEPSERELARINDAREGSDDALSVEVTLSDGTRYEQAGRLAQIENSISELTGTIAARAVVANPDRTLLPGQFVRARLVLDEREALLIPTEALSTDQGRRIVYVFRDDGTAEGREVEPGRIYGARTLIEEGLSAGDRVITSNLQRLKGGAQVVLADNAQQGSDGS